MVGSASLYLPIRPNGPSRRGTSIVCMRAPKEFGGQDMYSIWAYTKIVPMQTIGFIQNLSNEEGIKAEPAALGVPPDFPRGQRNLITFKSLGAGKTELTMTEFDWTVGPMLPMAEAGMNQSLDKTAASFAKA
jgi:hypothetical protein